MEDQVLITAEFSNAEIREKQKRKNKDSLIGTLMPLIVPVVYLLYMLVEEVKFSRLEPFSKFIILVCLGASLVFFFLHQKYTQINDISVKEAEEVAAKQSLTLTRTQIYGATADKSFSMPISDIEKIYSSSVAGNPSELILKMISGDTLVFRFVKNSADIIACFNNLNKQYLHSAPTNETLSYKEVSTSNAVNKTDTVLYDVIITSGSPTLSQLKALRVVTGLDAADAKSVFSALPYTVASSSSENKAKYMQRDLTVSGMSVELKIVP